jgi:uncharacterized protein
MKKLLTFSTTAITLLIVLPVLATPKKCEISCNPDYVKADDQLNQTWQSLTKTERQILRPSQRQWIKDRDRTCGKNDGCLTNETKKQTQQLNSRKNCVRNQGGLACFEGK